MLGALGKWCVGIVALLLTGCTNGPTAEAVRLDASRATPSADVTDLAAVLSAAVTEDGRVDAARLHEVADRLHAQLCRFAVSGPDATGVLYPTYGARVAYWLNARTAWSLQLALLAGCPQCAELGLTLRRPFPLNGGTYTLARIDEILLAEARGSGDFRVAACAPGVSVNFGPLPRTPYAPEELDERLQETLEEYVMDPRRFEIDYADQTVRVPPMLWACRDMVLEEHRRRYGAPEATLLTAMKSVVGPKARARLERAVGLRAELQPPREDLAIPRRKVFYPGRVGRIEP